MRESQAFPSNWMKAADAQEPTPLTITAVGSDTVGQGAEAEVKRVVCFKETEKELILNKTNWKAIAKISGQDDDDKWVGVCIEVFKTVVEYKGDHVDALRVRPPGGWEAWNGPGEKQEVGKAAAADSDLPF